MGDTVEWLPPDRSQLRAGYRGTEIMKTPEKDSESQVEVLEYDPPRRMRTSHAHELFDATAGYRLEPTGRRHALLHPRAHQVPLLGHLAEGGDRRPDLQPR